MDEQETLPYRTSGEDLKRFVSARARGRTTQQIRSLFTSDPAFQGTASAAEVLGLYDPTAEKLTELGKELASGEKDSEDVLLSAVLNYEPYELLLEAIFASGMSHEEEKEYTPLKWVESWWEDNGYGSSQTNRDEGSTAFANTVSFIDLGKYKQGRHGHPSRIEWDTDAERQVEEARGRLQGEGRGSKRERTEDEAFSEGEKDSVGERKEGELGSPPENNSLSLNLSDGRVAQLSLPPKLTSDEKRRLVSLVELMVETKGENETPQTEMDI